MYVFNHFADTTKVFPITVPVSGQPKESIDEEKQSIPHSFPVKIGDVKIHPIHTINKTDNLLIQFVRITHDIGNFLVFIIIFTIMMIIGPVIIIGSLLTSRNAYRICKRHFWLIVTIFLLSIFFWIIIFETTDLKNML